MSLKDLMKKKAWESTVAPHPLLAKDIDISVKEAYLGGVIMAALMDDGVIDSREQKHIDNLAMSLKLDADIARDLTENAKEQQTDEAKIQYLDELVPILQDRDTALFFLCDFAKILGADGQYSQDDLDYLNLMAQWLDLDEQDQTFLREYREFLLPEKEMDPARHWVVKDDVAKELLDYFTPCQAEESPGEWLCYGWLNYCDGHKHDEDCTKDTYQYLKRAQLPTSGDIYIGKGAYYVHDPLEFNADVHLHMEDADLTFGPNGRLLIKNAQATISHCRFDGETWRWLRNLPPCSPYFVDSTCPSLVLKQCVFSGNMQRAAIHHVGSLTLEDCLFSECSHAFQPIIVADKLTMKQCICDTLETKAEVILKHRRSLALETCIFYRCVSNASLFAEEESASETCTLRQCLFAHICMDHTLSLGNEGWTGSLDSSNSSIDSVLFLPMIERHINPRRPTASRSHEKATPSVSPKNKDMNCQISCKNLIGGITSCDYRSIFTDNGSKGLVTLEKVDAYLQKCSAK